VHRTVAVVPRGGRSAGRLVLALALAACTAALGAGSARPAPSICGTLGLDPSAVERAYAVLREVSDEQGTPVCEVDTAKGKAYASLYPAADARALVSSWEIDLHVTTQPLAAPGGEGATFYTAGTGQEAMGFVEGRRFVWLTSGGRYMHAELVALAGVIGGKLG